MFILPLRDINPTRRAPVITYLIIMVSFYLFFYELSMPPRILEMFIRSHAFIPAKFWLMIKELNIVGILSMVLWSTFLHGGWLHIIGNMWFLYVFGDNVEDIIGHHMFLLFYLFASFVGMFLHALIYPTSAMPVIGGSAAISGVLGAYMILFPSSPIETLLILGVFPFITYVSAYWYLLYWIVVQFVSGIVDIVSPVAYWAHVGGFVAGLWIGSFARSRRPNRYRFYSDNIYYYY